MEFQRASSNWKTRTPSVPMVTVVVPMLNEAGRIERCLNRFGEQTYPSERLEVVVVDGGSTDGSRESVDAFSERHGWCRVVDNPHRKAAAAFNIGVDSAQGQVLVLFSAHGEPAPDFIERSVTVLQETQAAGVGGSYLHVGDSPTSAAVGRAMVSPFGMASPHRSMRTRGFVDTISHPAYDIDALRAVGRFDETLDRNSDYELNFRMRRSGQTLLFDPSIVSTYRPRASLRDLARQFWWYGRWKERVVRQHPSSLRLRHLAPPVMTLTLALSPAALTRPAGRRVVALALAGYTAATAAATAHSRPRSHGASISALLFCFPVMHLSWGAGFLASLLEDSLTDRNKP
jgi:succinoglycan biosynthesis protein ExoA